MSTARPIRVLAVLPYVAGGGVERVVLDLARRMDKSVVDLRLLLLERIPNPLHEIPAEVPVAYADEGRYRKTKLPRLLLATVRAAREADVVIAANEGRAAGVAFAASLIARKPCVAMIHFNWDSFAKDAGPWTMRTLRMYRWMDRVVSCSVGAESSIRRIARLHPEKSIVIQNGIVVGEVAERSTEPLPPEFGTYFRRPTIVAVGRLAPEKGYDTLIDAHASIVQRGIEHELVFVGRGHLLDELRVRAEGLGVAGSVRFAGFQRNPYSFMRRAMVFALTSRSEGLPLVIAEAMACGTPVVATDCVSGPREILDGGRYGTLVPVGDVAALADALARVLADPSERTRLAAASTTRCRAYDVSTGARRWEELLSDVARPSHVSGRAAE